MTRHFNKQALRGKHLGLISAVGSSPSAKVSYSDYSCEVTVGTGADGNTPVNYHTNDSTEFYYGYTKAGRFFRTVTSNCIGTLPKGVTVPTSTVSHDVACEQFDPLNGDKPVIQGYGIETTFADGLYSETCNTPDYNNIP